MKQYITERNIRYAGIIILSLILPKITDLPCSGMDVEYALAFMHTFIFWEGDVFIIKFFRKKFTGIDETSKRITFAVISIIIYTVVAKTAIKLFAAYLGWITFDGYHDLYGEFLISFVTTTTIGIFYETHYFFVQWKKEIVAAEKLKNQQLKMELSVLKNQISPHFLFNSLNTLVTLIEEKHENAAKFTEKLSEVYRYILQNKEKELVKLEDELRFAESYLFLLKMRFGDNLHFEKDIKNEQLNKYVPPLTLQILIENAIKHNIVSHAQPLTIQLYSHENSRLIIQNTLQKKKYVKDSTRTGLENIKKRYQFISKEKVDIITTESYFMVALPLIKVEQNEMKLSV